MRAIRTIFAGGCLGVVFIGGCDRGEPAVEPVTVKSAPADPGNVPQAASPPDPSTAPAVPAAPTAGERQSAGGISWEIPPGWSRGGEGPMRLATITDGKAEIVISSFGGDVGGVFANVNRWRAQVGLPPAESDADAERQGTEMDVAGRKVRVFDFTGPENRTRVASVSGEGKLYFIKMTAPSAVVAERLEAFDRVVKSVRVE